MKTTINIYYAENKEYRNEDVISKEKKFSHQYTQTLHTE